MTLLGKFVANEQPATAAIVPVRFENRAHPAVGLEVLRLGQLQRRIPPHQLGSTQRLTFNLLLLVTRGGGEHVVNGVGQPLNMGDVIAVPSGHLQRFGFAETTEGIVVIFEDTFVLPRLLRGSVDRLQDTLELRRLPSRLVPGQDERVTLEDRFRALERDYLRPDNSGLWIPTLRHSLVVLLLNLSRLQRVPWAEEGPAAEDTILRAFCREVEKSFRRCRCVSTYAEAVGCTPRLLNRLCHDRLGKSAKEFISHRLIVEAKRLLAHTDLPVIEMALELGFTEATNFNKFFRAHAGTTPAAYRASMRGARPGVVRPNTYAELVRI